MGYELVVISVFLGITYFLHRNADKVKDENEILYVFWWYPLSLMFIPITAMAGYIFARELAGNEAIINISFDLNNWCWNLWSAYLIIFYLMYAYNKVDWLKEKIDDLFSALKGG